MKNQKNMNLHIKLLNEILNIKGEYYDRKGKNVSWRIILCK